MHSAIRAVEDFPSHACGLPRRKNCFPDRERVGHPRLQFVRGDPVSICAICHQRVRLTVADEIHSANFNICERLIYILRDGIADGRVAGQVECRSEA